MNDYLLQQQKEILKQEEYNKTIEEGKQKLRSLNNMILLESDWEDI